MKKRSEKQQDLEQLKSDLTKVSTVILTTPLVLVLGPLG